MRATITFDKGERRLEDRSARHHRPRHRPGDRPAKFAELAEDAKDNCPVSVALKGNVELAVDAQLA